MSRQPFGNDVTPTVILVHGAFTDGSSWVPVISHLRGAGVPDVVAVANPLRGLAVDAAHVVEIAAAIDGPVLLAGHSYGGAVISVAGAAASNVVGLVYVAAFIPDEGESCLAATSRFPGSSLAEALLPGTYPLGGGRTAIEVTIRPDLFRRVFAADLPESVTDAAARTQRPIAAAALSEPARAAAWRSLPSWALLAGADQAIHPEAHRYMAMRAASRTVEVNASHAVALSRPEAVADHIVTAVVDLATSAF